MVTRDADTFSVIVPDNTDVIWKAVLMCCTFTVEITNFMKIIKFEPKFSLVDAFLLKKRDGFFNEMFSDADTFGTAYQHIWTCFGKLL